MYILRKYITHTHILNARFENCQNGKKKNPKNGNCQKEESLRSLKSVIPNKLLVITNKSLIQLPS